MAVSTASTALMPIFASAMPSAGPGSGQLVGFVTKYTYLTLSSVAVVLALAAGPIIDLAYGPGYERSALLLQVLIWGQVLSATDAVIKQALIVEHREYAVFWRALTGTLALVALLVWLATRFDLMGAAVAVLLGALTTLTIDLVYSTRVISMDVGRFVVRPVSAGLVVGGVLVMLAEASLLVRGGAVVVVSLLLAGVLDLFPPEERSFTREAFRRSWDRVVRRRAKLVEPSPSSEAQ
jgi:O-antigen/teichoic acid export membrane protein